MMEISRADARYIRSQLLNFPVAPGIYYSHFINAGTDKILDILEENYFKRDIADGISSFKYLEGDYGTGKTQFINCLADRAQKNHIVTSLVSIGKECPFNSPLAIYRAVITSFLPPPRPGEGHQHQKGIEILFQEWIKQKLREFGVEPDQAIPDVVYRQIEHSFSGLWLGAPDPQVAGAMKVLGSRLLAHMNGAAPAVTDQDLIAWIRGDNVRSQVLRANYGLHEPVRDDNAFRRLKTVIGFLRTRLSYRGFFIAFDEGTRVASFRRGTVQQRQAIENMLTMINENAEGEFGGVMFLYAATPDFRSGVISRYTALQDRIGTVAFQPGRPMTPLIELTSLYSDQVIEAIGERFLEVFGKAGDISWDVPAQKANLIKIIQSIKTLKFFDNIPPRHFVYPYCRFLVEQENSQRAITAEEADTFILNHELPEQEGAE
jgi:hypothetical protein